MVNSEVIQRTIERSHGIGAQSRWRQFSSTEICKEVDKRVSITRRRTTLRTLSDIDRIVVNPSEEIGEERKIEVQEMLFAVRRVITLSKDKLRFNLFVAGFRRS